MTGTAPPAALELRDVVKSFGPATVLNGVSMDLRPGTIHALAGGNGSGKSTLIKILAGVETADSGTLRRPGAVEVELAGMTPAESHHNGLRFVHQDPGIIDDATIAENFGFVWGFPRRRSGGIRWGALHREVATVLEQFEIDGRPSQRAGSLRPSERTMLAVARALSRGSDDDVLILDEPTASLPHHEVDLLLDALRRRARAGQTIIYVSHRLTEVLDLADEVTVLRGGGVVASQSTVGMTSSNLADLMAGQPVRDFYPTKASGVVGASEVLSVEDLHAGCLRGVTLKLRANEVVGVAGLLGSGRSTLLRCIFGAQHVVQGVAATPDSDRFASSPTKAMATGIGLIPEDRSRDAVFPSSTLTGNVTIGSLERHVRRMRVDRSSERRAVSGALNKLRIKAPSANAPISHLSGGNQQKVVLARWMEREPRILLLDEPTQGVDVVARADIYRTIRHLARAGTGVLVASSDYEELANLCDRVLVLQRGQIVAELAGEALTPAAIIHHSYEPKEAAS